MKGSELDNFYIQLGKRVKELRENAGLKQEAFAQMLDLTRGSIVNIEKGRQRPPLHLLWTISKIVKLDVSEIIAPLENTSKQTDEKISSDWKKTITESTKGDPKSRKKLTDFLKEVI